MPDKDGKLSSEERDKAKEWLSSRQATRPCPSCGHPEWTIVEQLALVPIFHPGGTFVVGVGFPAVIAMCNRCTFFRLHSAILMGLVERDAKKDEAQHGS